MMRAQQGFHAVQHRQDEVRPAGLPVFAGTPTDTIVVVVQDETGAPLPFADIATVLQSLVTHFSADAQERAS